MASQHGVRLAGSGFLQDGDIKPRQAKKGMGRNARSNLIGSRHRQAHKLKRFDIITGQLKLIERNYTVETQRQCRGPPFSRHV